MPGTPTDGTAQARGALLFEYDPPRAHPILYAGLIVFGFVLGTGSLENALRDNRADLYALYAMPLAVTALILLLLLPSPVRIFENGIAPSRALALRWWRPFVPWSDVAACYPSSYDVTGAFVSPFASSDGKVTQTGIGIERRDGRTETVRFTPTRFSLTSRRSRGFREAWPILEERFRVLGRPLVPAAPRYTEAERATMLAQARQPFLPFFAIVFLFASAAPIAWVLLKLGAPVELALPIALLPPLGTSLRSWLASRRRNRILDALSKSAEHERELALSATVPTAASSAAAPGPVNALQRPEVTP